MAPHEVSPVASSADRSLNPSLRETACGLLRSMLALTMLLAAGHAPANTFFKCVDAKGAVTVQQTG